MTDEFNHDDAVIFDGLIVSNWGEAVFRDMRRGGLTGANCTCSVWEGFRDTMLNIGQWNRWFAEYGDLIVKARTTADIHQAKRNGKTAIVLGFQNTSAFEDRLEFVQVFKDAGVGIVQMTYNTQNLVGSGCYESTDGGLSDFGHEVVAEMNRVGMLCDLSHVGSKTSRDVIEASAKPVAFSHCLPKGLKDHPRNKTDDELRFIAERGGFIGVTMFPPFLARGIEAGIADYIEAIEYIINIAGEDAVGIGTDFTQGYGDEFMRWITHDKGYARQLTEFGPVKFPDGLGAIGDMPNLSQGMQAAGWPADRIRKIMGENWLRLLEIAWGG
ncbi:MAG: membrane dipeptidase [Rhodospirillaceae bacterium]|jgi:membrane dipeptidase|nr:membrane dipeptidase [Rhodospirillaceae bacterium]MBT5050368.1 membrane dipeptidase [Rhodospirillaceae bacterium]MBT5899144.1 membrane dipeptidase [Rhodospirillaceae bacterium]MBT6430441.1 membrane dipeptidase [Rhodospirillaceae bacterium]MBT7760037.1 membrane dipeptidase [Rhodospirillaceae bacterium]